MLVCYIMAIKTSMSDFDAVSCQISFEPWPLLTGIARGLNPDDPGSLKYSFVVVKLQIWTLVLSMESTFYITTVIRVASLLTPNVTVS